jgi:hypothetical protein
MRLMQIRKSFPDPFPVLFMSLEGCWLRQQTLIALGPVYGEQTTIISLLV